MVLLARIDERGKFSYISDVYKRPKLGPAVSIDRVLTSELTLADEEDIIKAAKGAEYELGDTVFYTSPVADPSRPPPTCLAKIVKIIQGDDYGYVIHPLPGYREFMKKDPRFAGWRVAASGIDNIKIRASKESLRFPSDTDTE